MKKPLLLFALKCTVIMYFAACTSIEDYTVAKSATPVLTKSAWKVTLAMDAAKDNTSDFAGYTFTFNSTGDLKASKNGTDITGNWAEDNIAKRITIDLSGADAILKKLNDNWYVYDISNAQVNLRSISNANSTININSL